MKLNCLKISLLNNIFIIVITITLLLISINIYYIFIIYILFLIYIFKNDKTLFVFSVSISLIILLIFIIIKWYQLYLINNYPTFIEGKIIDINNKEYYQEITIKYKIFKVIINDYEFHKLKIGDIIQVSGININIDSNHIPNGFNYQEVLLV